MYLTRIIGLENPTTGSSQITIEIPKGWNIEDFRAGQFLTLTVTHEGHQIRRNYSIVSADLNGIILCIKRIANGKMSSWLSTASVGMGVQISDAVGEFTFPKQAPEHVVFVAAGSGITPVLSMLIELQKGDSHINSVKLYYANKSPQEAIYLERVNQLCEDLGAELSLYFEESPTAESQKGILDKEVCQQVVGSHPRETHWFVCGPKVVQDNLWFEFERQGVPANQIHFESFVINKGVGVQASFEYEQNGIVRSLGTTENESILDAIIRLGEPVEFQCKTGVCQSCMLHLSKGELVDVKGNVIHEGDAFLSCQAYPKSNQPIQIASRKSGKSRNFWLRMAGVFALLLVSGFTFLNNGKFKMKGTYNTGHENLQCEDCHFESEGSIRQQIQHNTKTYFGLHPHEDYVDVGQKRVDNEACITCHQRPNDRHPVSRFKEIRFAEQRKNLGIHECRACHSEHTGTRMSMLGEGYCVNCHEDTKVKDDPLDVSHAQLFEQNQWQTCLQCHDFHGNHIYDVPVKMQDTFPLMDVKAYLNGEKTLYSKRKQHNALK